MDIKRFLKGNAREIPTAEFIPSDRFTDENGRPIPFLLKAVGSREFEELSESLSAGTEKKALRTASFKASFCALGVVSPDLKNADLQESYGVRGEAELLTAMLCVSGELNALYVKLNELSGFDKDFSELQDEAKN